MIGELGKVGSIIVYSSFEQTRIKALQVAFSDLAASLQGLFDRILDLHTWVADYVYSPKFKGSVSIKKVLPALVPALSYKDLAVRDGDTAITRFARMASGEISGDNIEPTRQQLLDYCKLDTYAMVSLHETLFNMAVS